MESRSVSNDDIESSNMDSNIDACALPFFEASLSDETNFQMNPRSKIQQQIDSTSAQFKMDQEKLGTLF